MLEPFTLLFDDVSRGESLPTHIRDIYQGDWVIPDKRPYIYSNFVLSRDGRVSFNEAGHLGGGDVSGFNRHDRWIMALLRARADGIIMGDNTLRLEPEHLWTHDYIYPEDTALFKNLRKSEQRREKPVHVFLSQEGDLFIQAEVFKHDLDIVIATTSRGAKQVKDLTTRARLHILDLGENQVDLAKMVDILFQDFNIQTLLCEGGPRAYGSMIQAGLMDEEFLTLSPVVIGNSQPSRPGLIEGVGFSHSAHPLSKPLSLRRAGDHLFLRSRYVYP
jgi:riboflavin biosynthesis pyrimidine reductase